MEGKDTINIETIMAEIRGDIRKKGYSNEMLSFQDIENAKKEVYQYSRDGYENTVNAINRNSYVPWYRELGQGGMRVVIKRYIRKLVTFLIAPMSDEQNLFNEEVAQAFNHLMGYVEKQEEIMESYKKDIQVFEKKVEKLERELGELKEK